MAQIPCGMQRIEARPALPSGHFGGRVALSESWLAVGSMGTPRSSISIYERWTGQFVRRFTGSNVVAFDGFPNGLVLDDQIVIAGGNGQLAYVFDVNTGTEILQLAPAVPVANATFGAAMAMDAAHIAVAAPGPFFMPSGLNGTVHLFDRVTG